METLGLAAGLERFEAEERLEAPVLAEGLERFDWDARLVEPDRAGLDRLTLELVFGLRPPPLR